ncbi:DUF4192 domain-containing protein [Nocardioides sp. HM23]|uniref:DUF4192 domain-containing protein n=1 Tax=Nocardioides bizhenqiangii TaxID=3095076 RepID=UPI002ACA4819|nr:DUF4192 domain-containing protein [Nocardioides sp. HM23]MDZ5620557.1 DUF4192 domain-containing protein [Nocardioides sp. HM23]
MTSTPMTLHVRCTEDLIAAAPVVLGFRPADSVVMITAGGEHVFHARTSLPTRADPRTAATDVAQKLIGPARRNGVRRVVFLFYSDDERVVGRVWTALRHGCERARLRIVDAVRVDGRRYYPLFGDKGLREVGISYDVAGHPFAAQAVLHGIVVEKDRDTVVATVAPDRDAQRAVQAALARAGLDAAQPPHSGTDRRRWGDWLQRVVGDHTARGAVASDDELARIGWCMQDVRVRDAAWALIRRPVADRHQAFWAEAVRRTPEPLVPAPAALLGWAAWQAGHGALAWIAIDRCREVDPDYGVAAILAHCLDQAVPPGAVEADFAWDEGLPA